MTKQNGDEPLTEDQRKEIFLALGKAQDDEMNVAVSRKAIANQFSISDRQVRRIEREGLDCNWPLM